MKKITGKYVDLRLVMLEDSKFIVDLRNGHKNKKNLGNSVKDYGKQREWLLDYKKREDKNEDFYYVIENKNKEKIGLVRIYDIQNSSFELGSLVIVEGMEPKIVIETLIMAYTFGFKDLGLTEGRLRVKKENKVGNKFHKNYHAVLYKEDLEFNYYSLKKEAVKKLENFLTLLSR